MDLDDAEPRDCAVTARPYWWKIPALPVTGHGEGGR